MINRKLESSLQKVQSFYNDELQVLRKELESEKQIVNKKTIENISSKPVQPTANRATSLWRWLNWYKRIWERGDQSTNNNQKDSQQEMNNLDLRKTDSIEKELNDVKTKKWEEYYRFKTNFQKNTTKESIATEHNINSWWLHHVAMLRLEIFWWDGSWFELRCHSVIPKES